MKLLLLFILSFSFQAFAVQPEVNTFGEGGSFLSDPPRTDTAIKGYDSVAYFTMNRPVKGSEAFVTVWKGAKWKFSSKENLEKFVKEPETFAPQYGGYCAYGVAKGNLVKIEPDQFKVVNGKLYLNYDEDVSEDWKKDIPGYIKSADKKFAELLKD